MASRDTDPSKRVPKSLGTDPQLLGTYTLTDLGVALAPGVAVVLATQVLVPTSIRVAGYSLQALTLPLAAVAIAGGALFVYLTPAYASSAEWLGLAASFYRGDRAHDHEAAKPYTNVERVHPDQDAIERTDGAVIGVVQVTPPTMALATDAEWAAKADQFRTFCNTALEFPVQLYATTQPFPAEQYLARYEDRLDDPDVEANARLATLIEEYVEWYRAELADRQTTIRDHYVVVPVTPQEVQFERTSLVATLATVPVVGLVLRGWLAPGRPAERAAQLDALDDRLQRVAQGLREIDGCAAHRLAATETTRVIAEFWAGESRAYDDLERALRTWPIVGGDG